MTPSRRIIVTGHVEVLASPKAVLTHEYHLMVGQQIKVGDPPPSINGRKFNFYFVNKDYFHDIGIHSTTIQIEYSFSNVRY